MEKGLLNIEVTLIKLWHLENFHSYDNLWSYFYSIKGQLNFYLRVFTAIDFTA